MRKSIKKSQFIAPKCAKKGSFWTSTIPEIGLTENLSDMKLLKFPRCVLPKHSVEIAEILSHAFLAKIS